MQMTDINPTPWQLARTRTKLTHPENIRVPNIISKPSHLGPLNILQLNCNKNFHVLLFCIDQYEKGLWSDLDVLCISEPPYDSLNQTIHVTDSKFRSYYWSAEDPTPSQRPNTAIILLNSLLKLDQEPIFTHKNRVALSLQISDFSYTIHSVYVPTTDHPEARLLALKDIALVITQAHSPTLIVGDFNLHSNRWEDFHRKKQYSTQVEQQTLLQPLDNMGWLILNEYGVHTRYDPNGRHNSSTIDLALSSPHLSVSKTEWTRLQAIEGTDHYPIKITLHTHIPNPPNISIPHCNYKLAKAMAEVLNQSQQPSFEQFYNAFQTKFAWIRQNKNFAQKPNKYQGLSPQQQSQIKSLKTEIRHLKSVKKKSIPSQNIYEKIHSLRREIAKILKKSKPYKLKKMVKDIKTHHLWRHLPIRKARRRITAIITENKTLRDSRDILQAIMDFPPQSSSTFPPLPIADESCLPDTPLTPSEVIRAFKVLKPGTAKGHDAVAYKLIRRLYKNHPEFFIQAYINVYERGSIPSQWRTTKLIILPKKKNSKVELQNIRLIGIPSQVAKVFQHILNARLLYHTATNKILDDSQFGSLPGSSSCSLLQELDPLLAPFTSLHPKNIAILSKIDVEKAFDNAPHHLLIQSLINANFPAKLTNLVREFLIDHQESAVLDDHTTSREKKIGTTQGAIFSPLLFSILMAQPLKKLRNFINSLSLLFPQIIIRFYVYLDDLILLVKTNDTSLSNWSIHGAMIQGITSAIIEKYHSFLNEINLSVAHSKLEHIAIPQTQHKLTVTILGRPINQVQELKILGVTYCFTDRKYNTSHALTQARKGINLVKDLHQQGQFLNTHKRMLMTKAAILNKLFYGEHIWGNRIRSDSLLKLEQTTRFAMIKAIKAHQSTPSLTATIQSGITPASVRIKLATFKANAIKFGIVSQGHYYKIERNVNPFMFIHPAKLTLPSISGSYTNQSMIPPTTLATLSIYTDASLTQTTAGFAILQPDNAKFLLYKTTTHTNSFTLELAAIHTALENISFFRQPFHTRCIIFTDSRSALDALSNPTSKHHIINQIRFILKEPTMVNFVEFAWVKGHAGIIGNEWADSLAAIASKFGNFIDIDIPQSSLNKFVEEEKDYLMQLYFHEHSAKHFKLFYPSWAHVKLFLTNPTHKYMCFVNSQSNYMRKFLFDLKRNIRLSEDRIIQVNSPYCECNSTSHQTAIHLVLECQIFNTERHHACTSLQISDQSFQDFKFKNRRDSQFYKLTHHIYQIAEAKLQQIRENIWNITTNNSQG